MTKVVGATRGVFGANTHTAATRVGDMTYVKHDQFIGRSLKMYGEWAQLEIDRLLDYVAPGDFVIDVGANIGFHTLSFARKVGKLGMVWAFEPDPVNGLLLRHNILQSGLDAVIVPFDLAVSDKFGICRFRTAPIAAPENFGHTCVDSVEGDYPRVAVPLDALLIDRAPALIKIDIEGHELPALGGMFELVDKHRPVLSIEADTPDEVETNGAFLAAMGYDIYSLVVSAYNPGNFAENSTDIWKGYGRCANLLCVVPGKHAAPEGLDLVRSADPGRRAVSHLGKSVGAAYSAMSVLDKESGDLPAGQGLSDARAEIKRFISNFLKTTYGKLDPVTDAAIVDGALDFLAANGPSAEGVALQQLIVAGVQSFVDALNDRAKFAELAELRVERERLRSNADELRSDLDALSNERQDIEVRHARALEDVNSRLAAADGAQVRLSAELAQQAESARREVAAALAQAAEAEKRAMDAEATIAQLSSDLAAREAALEVSVADWGEREAELVAACASAEQDSLRLSAELAQQAESARREVAAALAQAAEAEKRAMDAEAQGRERASVLEKLEQQLSKALQQHDQLKSELTKSKKRSSQEVSELARKLEAAKGEAEETAMQVAQLQQQKRDLEMEFSRLQGEQASLSSELAEAQERLALQAQQLRQLRLG
jgi:FkbM family methyltransferase